MSKNEGKVFEENIKSSIDESGLWCYRPPDTSTSWGGGMASRFTSKSHCDLFVHIPTKRMIDGVSFLTMELKSTKSSSVPFVSKEDFDKYSACKKLISNMLERTEEHKRTIRLKSKSEEEKLDAKTKLDRAKVFIDKKKLELKQLKKLLTAKSIKYHQIENMMKDSKYENCMGGFLFNFRDTNNETYFIQGDKFYCWWSKTSKKSINISDIKSIGGVLINNEKIGKSKNYKYTFDGILWKDV